MAEEPTTQGQSDKENSGKSVPPSSPMGESPREETPRTEETPPTQPNHGNSENGKESVSRSWWEKSMVVANFIMAASAVATIWVVYIMNSDQNEITAQYSKADLRAYLAINDLQMYPLKVGEMIRVDLIMKNVGKTPARQIVHNYTVKIGTGIYPQEIDSLLAKQIPRFESVIGQGMTDNYIIEFRPFTETDQREVFVLGTKRLYCFGIFIYVDKV